jgi:predicted methyltransferase
VRSPADVIVAEVAAAVGLAEGEDGVRSVVFALARLEPVSVRRLSRVSGLPVPLVASVCGELRKRDAVALEHPAQLTAFGRRVFAAGALRLPSPICDSCAGRGLAIPDELSPVVRDLARLARDAPEPRLDLDQCHCTVETKLRRVLALHESDALVGRRILLLGDDDLVSLAIASVVRRFGSRRTVANLTVVDVDPAVVAWTRGRLAKAPFSVACLEHDLREPLPSSLEKRFDTVLTDPPYTPAGSRLFLSRAATAVREGGRVFLSFGSRRPDAAFVLQQDLAAMGFAIARLARDFNRYVGAGVLGGTSDLYEIGATRALRPLVTGRFDEPLYTAEVGLSGSRAGEADDVVSAPDEDLRDELRRKEAVLDDARSPGEESRRRRRVVDRSNPVREHASVGRRSCISEPGIAKTRQRRGEAEGDELERDGRHHALDELC